MMTRKNLLRAPLRTFKNYVAGKPIEEVRREYGLTGPIAKLASNENPLGVSPLAAQALRDNIENVWLYADDASYYFRKRVARHYGVGIEHVIALSGSVEAIELCGYAFLTPDDAVVTSEHTFPIYYLVAQKAGATLKAVPMTDGGFRYDMAAINRAVLDEPGAKVVFLANPTNPGGTWFTAAEFDAFMEKVPEDVLVFYDSAYEEYAVVSDFPDPYKHFRAGRRIVISRTFSKAYGLAGARAAYAIGPEDIIAGMMTCRAPFNMTLLAQAAATAAMDDVDFVRRSREFNAGEMEFMRRGLEAMSVKVYVPPSQANFVLIDTPVKGVRLFEELQKKGLIVRPCGGYGYPNAIRVSFGLRPDNERFLREFEALLTRETAG